jgi:hypothetical protein
VDAWVPELQAIVGVDRLSLPVIWDIDSSTGRRPLRATTRMSSARFNASSTFAFPEDAMPAVARAALDRIGVTDS